MKAEKATPLQLVTCSPPAASAFFQPLQCVRAARRYSKWRVSCRTLTVLNASESEDGTLVPARCDQSKDRGPGWGCPALWGDDSSPLAFFTEVTSCHKFLGFHAAIRVGKFRPDQVGSSFSTHPMPSTIPADLGWRLNSVSPHLRNLCPRLASLMISLRG